MHARVVARPLTSHPYRVGTEHAAPGKAITQGGGGEGRHQSEPVVANRHVVEGLALADAGWYGQLSECVCPMYSGAVYSAVPKQKSASPALAGTVCIRAPTLQAVAGCYPSLACKTSVNGAVHTSGQLLGWPARHVQRSGHSMSHVLLPLPSSLQNAVVVSTNVPSRWFGLSTNWYY